MTQRRVFRDPPIALQKLLKCVDKLGTMRQETNVNGLRFIWSLRRAIMSEEKP